MNLYVGSPVAIWTRSRFAPPNLTIPDIRTSTTTMPARKSQKRAEADKRIEKALDELSMSQFQSIHEAAHTNNITHTTLLRRMDGGKSTTESRESQQILTIPEENALAECITHLTIVEHPSKHAFIYKLAKEIRFTRLNAQNDSFEISSIHFSIGDF